MVSDKERKRLDNYYFGKYGVKYKYYEDMWAAQGYACALCGRMPKPGQKRYALDHCHATGKVRQILCYYCNKFRVGRLNVEWAYKIWRYLVRNA